MVCLPQVGVGLPKVAMEHCQIRVTRQALEVEHTHTIAQAREGKGSPETVAAICLYSGQVIDITPYELSSRAV